jgi:hypothetical protein
MSTGHADNDLDFFDVCDCLEDDCPRCDFADNDSDEPWANERELHLAMNMRADGVHPEEWPRKAFRRSVFGRSSLRWAKRRPAAREQRRIAAIFAALAALVWRSTQQTPKPEIFAQQRRDIARTTHIPPPRALDVTTLVAAPGAPSR